MNTWMIKIIKICVHVRAVIQKLVYILTCAYASKRMCVRMCDVYTSATAYMLEARGPEDDFSELVLSFKRVGLRNAGCQAWRPEFLFKELPHPPHFLRQEFTSFNSPGPV